MPMHLRGPIVRGLAVATLALGSAAAQAVPFYWTDWQGSDLDPGVGFQGQGVITTPASSVTVTYTNALGVSFYQNGVTGTLTITAVVPAQRHLTRAR